MTYLELIQTILVRMLNKLTLANDYINSLSSSDERFNASYL